MAFEGQFINYIYPTVDVRTKLEPLFVIYSITVSAIAIDVIDKILSDFEESFS